MKKLSYIATLLLISNFQFAIGQSDIPPDKQQKIDSLRQVIKTTPSDTIKVKVLNDLSWIYKELGHYDQALQTAQRAKEKGQRAGFEKGEAASFIYIGIIYDLQGHYDQALEYYHKAFEFYKQAENRTGMSSCYINIGLIHKNQRHYERALEFYHKALELYKQLGDRKGMASCYNNIGQIHKTQDYYNRALEFYRKSLNIKKQIGYRAGMANSFYNIGDLYITLYKKDTLTAESRQFKREIQQYHPYALLDSARYYQQKALQLAKKIGRQSTITNASMGLANILQQKEEYEEALPYYHKATRIANSTGARPRLYEAYKRLSECYKELDQYQKAYEYHVKYAAIQDSVHSVESKKKIAQMEQQYKAEKRKRKIAEQEAELQKQRLWLYSTGGGLFIILLFSGILYNRFRVIRRQKRVIETAHHTLEQKNREITASINYAKRIQEALLGKEEHETSKLPPHFVLLLPQATVSGDFYWGVKKEGHWYIAAADCTGHGVPGGFLTMLGTAFLNEITSRPEQVAPATILNELRERFIKELGEEEKEADTGMRMRDGMDISLLRLNLKTNEAQWAGANNPLYVIRHKNKASIDKKEIKTLQKKDEQLYDIPPDKQPISYTQDPQPFTNHKLKLQKDDSLYMFSDGYPDQFGGPRGKKFKKKRFKRTLLDLQAKNMKEQKEQLDKTIKEWMAQNDEEQIDDICVLGLKIP